MATGDDAILKFLESRNGEAAVGAMCNNLREEPWRKCEVRCKPGARVCVAVAVAMAEAMAMADDDICKLGLGFGVASLGKSLGRVFGVPAWALPMSQRLSRWPAVGIEGSLRRLASKEVCVFVSFLPSFVCLTCGNVTARRFLKFLEYSSHNTTLSTP